MALNFAVEVGHAQGSPRSLLKVPLCLDDFWINKGGKAVICLVVVVVSDHHNSVEPVDLYSRQRYAYLMLGSDPS